jgi:hypothetical protein
VRRAVAFNERLRALPGDIEVDIQVEPPWDEARVENLSKTLRLPIPAPIQRFLTSASANCSCRYYWDPPEGYDKRVSNILGTDLIGGPSLCNASDFEGALSGFLNVGNAMEEAGWPQERLLWHNSFPLCDEGGGNCLGLFLRPRCPEAEYYPEADLAFPVVYLWAQPGGYSRILDENFDQFLTHWEDWYYLWPHILLQFSDPISGRISPDLSKREPLRQLFADVLGTPP